jgi:hypothetical protein
VGLTFVSASALRNWFAEDPLLDWLDLYGEQKGFIKNPDRAGYLADTQMSEFLFAKGREFESRVVDLLHDRCEITTIASHDRAEAAEETEALIKSGVSAIYQGYLINSDTQTGGRPDLIIRNDVLHQLCECPPEDVGTDRHYRVVDIKFTSLDLNVKGFVGNGSDRRRKAQLYVYNRALASLQGYFPPVAYLISRGTKIREERIDNCLHKLAPALMTDTDVAEGVESAVHWIRRVRRDGATWNVLPEPDIEELRPNAGNEQDWPWHLAKKEILDQLHDLTSLWQVTPKRRPQAIARGVSRWDDPNCHSSLFDLSEKMSRTLQRIIESQAPSSPSLSPDRISTEREVWHPKPTVEFYVDFETVSSVDDKFDLLPQAGGQPLIFMIGCGHEHDGEWKFKCFTTDRLTEPDEAGIIDAWIDHMVTVAASFNVENPTVYHWSHAERSSLTTAFNAARVRHPKNKWPEPNWYDFLNKVMKPEPVTVKGSLAFGLKSVAKAMANNDMITTRWADGPTDGLGAMVGAWRCDAKAEANGCRLIDIELMKQIRDYNEVDCKVMWEAIMYLRKHH